MNGIYFCKLFLESTFTFANWNLNLQLTTTTHSIALFCRKLKYCVCYRCNIIRKSDCVFKNKFPLTKLGSSDDKLAYCSGTHEIYIVHSVNLSAVQSMEISVSSSKRSSTQAVSRLNSQDKIFLIVVTS